MIKPAEWRRLTTLHIQNDDYKSALDSMRLPFENGLLKLEKDYRQMAQLLFHSEVPFKAGNVLSEGMDKEIVAKNIRNLRQLAGYWVVAKEYDKAIDAYKQLTVIDPKRKWYKQLANLYFQKKEWAAATQVLNLAP